MKKIALSLSLLFVPACDEEPTADPVAPRGGTYQSWYVNQNIAQIDLQGFAKFVLACDGIEDADLAVTYTRYQHWPAGDARQVIGLGFSYNAGDALAQCYEDAIIASGGVPFP
jgi:hypothetical protein